MGTRAGQKRFAAVPRLAPPLEWRKPAFLWTPAAIALALGWPALALQSHPGFARASLLAGAIGFGACLIVLGVAWAMKTPPRRRVHVIRLMLWVGVALALAAPFVGESLIEALPNAQGGLEDGFAFALMPLALLLGIPVALFSGVVFSTVALVKADTRKHEAPPDFAPVDMDVNILRAKDPQPFN